MSRALFILLVVAVAVPGSVRAEVCPRAVVLAGEPEVVARIGELLVAHRIALEAAECGAIEVRVEQRGETLVVDVTQPGGGMVERVVGDEQTAATVIESFTRVDVGAPLLATRAVPSDPPTDVREPTDAPEVHAIPRARRGVQLFSAFETSVGSDRTGWLGTHLGACIMLGPVCAAGRIRIASVTTGPGIWEDQVERRGTELLFGIDIPFAIGRLTFSPGFAAGLGQMHTRSVMDGRRSETGGLRADVHATLSVPLSRRLALDVFTAADLTQETRGDWEMLRGAPMVALPDEPRLLVRLGVGLRYGGL